jgi:hypothetical protein
MRDRDRRVVIRTWTNLGLLPPVYGAEAAQRQLDWSARLAARLAGIKQRYLAAREAVLATLPAWQQLAALREERRSLREARRARRAGSGAVPSDLAPIDAALADVQARLREVRQAAKIEAARVAPDLDGLWTHYLAQVQQAVAIERDAGLLWGTAESLVLSYRRAREQSESPMRQLVYRYTGGADPDALRRGRVVRLDPDPPAAYAGGRDGSRRDRIWTLRWLVPTADGGRETIEWPVIIPRSGLRETVLGLDDRWRLKHLRVVARPDLAGTCPEPAHEACGHPRMRWSWTLAITAERVVEDAAQEARVRDLLARGPVLLANAHWARLPEAKAATSRAPHEAKTPWHRLTGLCPVAVGLWRDGRLVDRTPLPVAAVDPVLEAQQLAREAGLEVVQAKRDRIRRDFVEDMIDAGVLPAQARGGDDRPAWGRRTIDRRVRAWIAAAADPRERAQVAEAFRGWLRLDRHEGLVIRGVSARLARVRRELARMMARRLLDGTRPVALVVERIDLAALRQRPPEEQIARETGARRQAAYQARAAAPGIWIAALESAAERAGLPMLYVQASATLDSMGAEVEAGRVVVRWPGDPRPRVRAARRSEPPAVANPGDRSRNGAEVVVGVGLLR